MGTWLAISLAIALLGIVAYFGGSMWRAERRGARLRRTEGWGGFVVLEGKQLTPPSPVHTTADPVVARLPKRRCMGFLYVTAQDIAFRPLPFGSLWGGRGFRLPLDQVKRVHYGLNDPRAMFIELNGYDGQLVCYCSRRKGLEEAMDQLIGNRSPEDAG